MNPRKTTVSEWPCVDVDDAVAKDYTYSARIHAAVELHIEIHTETGVNWNRLFHMCEDYLETRGLA